jgi:arylsulfatase A-like enzyme
MKLQKLIISILFFIAIVSCSENHKEKEEEKPNILFLSINDTNDFVGFLDGRYKAKTPNMDRLAEKGINFTNAHCATPSCGPSRNALLFGQYPFNSGLYRYNQEMFEVQKEIRKSNPEFISLPQLLKENGYSTYASGEIHCYDWTYTYMDGKIEWTGHYLPKSKKMKPIYELGYSSGKNESWKFYPTTNDDSDYESHDVINYGIEILEQEHDVPFFLALGLTEAHIPLMTPKKYFDLYPEFELVPMYPNDLDDVPAVGLELAGKGLDYKQIQNDGKWDLVIKSYLATLSFVDNQVGRIISALEKSKYGKNTVIILWSDHGNHYGSKGKLSKFTLWEGATRVPLVIWDLRKKDKKGMICSESTSLVDLYPTITTLTGITPPGYLDGIDLTPWLKNPSAPRKTPAITAMGRGNYSIRTKDWRYIRYFDGGEELYNNTLDKLELKNLADIEDFSNIKEELKKWLPAYEAPLNDMHAGFMKFFDADFVNEN